MTDENNSEDQEAQNQESSAQLEPDMNEPPSVEEPAKAGNRNDVNLEALLKVPVALSIEVGRKQMRLDDLLETQEGAVIELDKLLNEPLDILVNGALIAHGVIVLAQDRFGIQITDILSPEERARSL